MDVEDIVVNKASQSLKPTKLTLDDLLAEKKQRELLQSKVTKVLTNSTIQLFH